MLKYLKKIATDILPSVVATVIGAYIVNHYVTAKPATDAPPAAVSSAEATRADLKTHAHPVAAAANHRELGVRTKGISEKKEKMAAERLAKVKPLKSNAAESRRADAKPFEAARSVEARRRQEIVREKQQPKAATSNAKSVRTAADSANQYGDAAALARAAIERLRTTEPPRAEATARISEPPRVQEPRTAAVAPVPPLPPSIVVSIPPAEAYAATAPAGAPVKEGPAPATPSVGAPSPYTATIPANDPNEPIPPADIPPAQPSSPSTDLHAGATAPSPQEHASNIAQDMLSAAKSMFRAVLPSPQPGTQNLAD